MLSEDFGRCGELPKADDDLLEPQWHKMELRLDRGGVVSQGLGVLFQFQVLLQAAKPGVRRHFASTHNERSS